jgi:transcriptional regulator with XRE-family HTH domain
VALRSDLVTALKRLLKARGLTYAALAARIGLSEASVKRMFSRQTLSLAQLEAVCGVLEVGLDELALEAQAGRAPLAELSEAAERALVEDPALLLALYLVLNRWTREEVLARYRMSPLDWTALLIRLDRLGVLELQPGDRPRLRTARNFRWRPGGPMEAFFRRALLPGWFGRGFEGPGEDLLLLSGMVAPASAEVLRTRLQALAEEFDALMARDARLPAAQRVGVSLVLARRPWSLDLFDPLRRASTGADG